MVEEVRVPVTIVPRPSRRGSLVLTLVALVGLVIPGTVLAVRPPVVPIDIQLLNVSDWHGQLDPVNVTGVGNVGGAAAISAYWAADRLANPNTLTLTAGDDVGATPPLSNYFDDVPAILSERLMGIQVGTFGNHNFDAGLGRLQDQIDLAAVNDGSEVGSPFGYVSANLQNRDANISGVQDYRIFTVGGVKVAVIGITNPEAPGLVTPGNFGTIVVTDPVKAALKARNAAKDAGAEVIVVITHMGVTGFDNGVPFGPLIDFANAVNAKTTKVDVILGDHTDVKWSGTIKGALVQENASKGVSYAKTAISVDPNTRRVISSSVTFVTPLSGAVTADPAITAMLSPYRTSLAAIFDGKIATATGRFPRAGSPSVERSGESALGDLVADAIRLRYGVDFSLYNGGSIRQPLPSSYVPLDLSLDRTDPAPYDIVVGDIYAVLPFGNSVVTRNVTGAQLWDAIQNGVSRTNWNGTRCVGADGRFPQISGFKFTFTCTASSNSGIVTSITLSDGTTAVPDSANSLYTFATSNFVNAGGDFYSMFVDGQGVTRDLDAKVLLDYVDALDTISPTLDGRITGTLAP